MPVAPGPRIEHPRRRTSKNLAERALREVMPGDGEILKGPVGHHLGEKTVLIREGLLRGLPPEETGSHGLQIGHGTSPSDNAWISGRRLGSTFRTASLS